MILLQALCIVGNLTLSEPLIYKAKTVFPVMSPVNASVWTETSV